MHHFCTYFDRGYMVRALALYASLHRHCPAFTLWVLAMDEACEAELRRLNLPHVTVLPIAELERSDPQLAAARGDRSRIEYYFTCTPALVCHLFDAHPEIDRLTYMDADLFFFADPAPIFAEMGEASVAITPHRYPAALQHLEIYGRYNVGWNTFRRNESGLACARAWREDCIRWCYDRVEDGKFADQKYLDAWPDRFDDVVELCQRGANAAPWNLAGVEVAYTNGALTIGGDPLIFFHFHGFKALAPWLYNPNLAAYGATVSEPIRQAIFAPYVQAVQQAAGLLGDAGSGASIRVQARTPLAALKQKLRLARDVGVGLLFGRLLIVTQGRVW